MPALSWFLSEAGLKQGVRTGSHHFKAVGVLGYANLYAVCTQVGADAAPPIDAGSVGAQLEQNLQERLSGYRWMTVVLFGEGVGTEFARGVGQYPTVGDEVHLVTNDDLKTIYGSSGSIPERYLLVE